MIALDESSIRLLENVLRESEEVTLLGCVTKQNICLFFRGGAHLNKEDGVFPGHRDLLDCGVIPSDPRGGFSFTVRTGKLAAFYRRSILNVSFSDFRLPKADVEAIISLIAAEREQDFRVYPKYGMNE